MAVVLAAIAWTGRGHALEPAEAVKPAQEYLAIDDDDRRAELAEELSEYDGDIESVLRGLQPTSFEPVEPGYHPEEHFSLPELREARPDDLLYFTVPESYRADRPSGLVVFMHGGGNATSRRAPRYTMNFPDEEDDESDLLGDLFDELGLVAVGPSAPWDEESSYRWCLEKADEYLADVIQECKSRFNIDHDRVFLLGHSMGGFGAFHHAQRQPDRFAAVIAHAGSWQLGCWPVIRGTRLCFINGVHDAEQDDRWHYTDIEHARWTERLLAERELDHVFFEHDGGHDAYYGKPYIARFLRSAKDLRRDPFYAHIALASPVGYSRYYSSPVKHNRWLTLNESTAGQISYDELLADDDVEFDDWELEYSKSERDGAAIEAHNRGDNVIDVTTQNVARFTVWLHPKMIDVRRPVRVVVDGETRFDDKVEPSLVTALESYERRGDWGLVYPIKIELDLEEGQ